MSSPKNPKRRDLLNRLSDLGRIMSTQTVFLHQAIAQRAGLNATDTKCVDLILRGPQEGATAGWLSHVTGLTTGAVTHILDRLEKRGIVARVRDCDPPVMASSTSPDAGPTAWRRRRPGH